MAYTNSPLVSYTKLSPNNSGLRNHAIDTITIHCVVGQCSVETLGNMFARASKEASSNYGIGKDGRIGLYCEEKNRSWCSGGIGKDGNPIYVNGISGSMNDQRAITIEVACDTKPPYAVTDAAYNALIKLCADICKRNGIKKLLWKADKSLVGKVDKQNMTVHRWFANKACPGDYLYNRHGEIAAEVNKRLGSSDEPKDEPAKTLYRVQTGAFSVKTNADALVAKLKAKGFDTYMVKVGSLYKVQVGAFGVKSNADAMMAKLKAAGFEAFITTESGTAVAIGTVTQPSVSLAVGDKVKLASNAPTYSTSKTFASWVYKSTLYVREISGDRIVISTLKTGAITGAVDKKYLTKI